MQSLYFLYHELRAHSSSYTYALPCEDFERHCELFARLQQPNSGTLRPELTFDDGHRSNHDLALPILERHGLKARFFITAGWTGTRADYMGWSELRALSAAGHEIGAHGWTHKLLTHCTPAELDQELVSARRVLEDGLGSSITTMSLPGGRANQRVLDAAWAAGYTAVFTSVPEPAPLTNSDRKIIGRLNVTSHMTATRIADLLHTDSRALLRLQRQERAKKLIRTMLGDSLYARLWATLNHEETQATE